MHAFDPVLQCAMIDACQCRADLFVKIIVNRFQIVQHWFGVGTECLS